MQTIKQDASFYAVIAAHRPDLLDYDDIRALGKALLDEIPIRKPSDKLPKKVKFSQLSNGQTDLFADEKKPRRRRKRKSAKRGRRHPAAVIA